MAMTAPLSSATMSSPKKLLTPIKNLFFVVDKLKVVSQHFALFSSLTTMPGLSRTEAAHAFQHQPPAQLMHTEHQHAARSHSRTSGLVGFTVATTNPAFAATDKLMTKGLPPPHQPFVKSSRAVHSMNMTSQSSLVSQSASPTHASTLGTSPTLHPRCQDHYRRTSHQGTLPGSAGLGSTSDPD